MNKVDIINAWETMRKTNSTIPDEVLDIMKNGALALLERDPSLLKFRRGDKFKDKESDGKTLYMLCQIASNKYILINMDNGNRYSEPKKDVVVKEDGEPFLDISQMDIIVNNNFLKRFEKVSEPLS